MGWAERHVEWCIQRHDMVMRHDWNKAEPGRKVWKDWLGEDCGKTLDFGLRNIE